MRNYVEPEVTDGPDALRAMTNLVRSRLADVLALPADEIAEDAAFDDLGLDSILALDLVRVLDGELNRRLEATDVYDYDTVSGLARLLLEAPAPEAPAGQQEAEPGSSKSSASLEALVADALGRPIDPAVSFADNGLTSFDMIRVISLLEKQLGSLPKTLLFDHPTVADLAKQLAERNGGIAPALHRPVQAQSGTAATGRLPALTTRITDGEPVVVVRRRLADWPELADTIADLHSRYAEESGLAGRDIAPLLFLGSRRQSYFNFSIREDDLFAWSYVGRDDDFPDLVTDWLGYAARHELKANFLSLIKLDEVAGVPLTATAFGALQRLEDLAGFTLSGGRMSRLRYLINRIERLGEARTSEYQIGSDPGLDSEIVTMIDRWASAKQMTNPYVAVVREEISGGSLGPRHRTFLTYINDELVNVVIVTSLPARNGYLLDLEFYPPEMPLGGLDYAIVAIIRSLAERGCDTFSFGASFGVGIGESATADLEIEGGLRELKSVGIFDEGNFQFKNKYRPANLPIYLCRPAIGRRTSMSDIILMIANPDLSLGAAPDAAEPDGRQVLLARHHYNPLAIGSHAVRHDLSSDSWQDLDGDMVRRRLAELARLPVTGTAPAGEPDPGPEWLPQNQIRLLDSMAAARTALCKCWQSERGLVPTIGVGAAWRDNLRAAGFSDRPVIDTELDAVLKSSAPVAFLLIGLGRSMSVAELTAMVQAARSREVRVVLDASRLPGWLARPEPDVRRTATELPGLADTVLISLTEDFALPAGAVIATDDERLAGQVFEHILLYGCGLSAGARRSAMRVIDDLGSAVTGVRRRDGVVSRLRENLIAAGLPVAPAGSAPEVVLPLDRLGHFDAHAHPATSALAWIYLRTGVKAGPMADEDGEGLTGPERGIRLAVPVGTPDETADEVSRALAGLLVDPGEVPDLIAVRDTAQLATARYHPAAGVPDDIRAELSEGHAPADDNWAVLLERQPAARRDVLRVGDAEVEVFTAGDGPVLLLMHPFNIGAGIFAQQFADLAGRYRVMCVHHPGVGASKTPGDLSLDGVAEVDRAVVSQLGASPPFHIAGSSFGGLTALAFALKFPGDVGSLVLIGSSYTLDNRVGEVNRLSAVAALDLRSAVEGSRSRRLRRELPQHEEQILRCESMDAYTGLRYLDVFAARPSFLPRLSEVAVPTLVVHGRYDTVVPMKAAHLLHGAMPLAQFEELAEAGHFPMVTCARQFNALLTDFLAKATGQNGSR